MQPVGYQDMGIFVLRDSRDKAELASLLGVKPDDILPHQVCGGEGIVDEEMGDMNGIRKAGPIKGASYVYHYTKGGNEGAFWYWMPIGYLLGEENHGFFLPDSDVGERGKLLFTGDELETWKKMRLAGAGGIHASMPPEKKLDEDGNPVTVLNIATGEQDIVMHDPNKGKHSYPYPRRQPIIMMNNEDFAQVNMRLDETTGMSSFMPHNEKGELASLSNLLVLIPSDPVYRKSGEQEEAKYLKHMALQMGKTEDGLSGMVKFAKNKYMSLPANFQKKKGSQVETYGILSRAEGCRERTHVNAQGILSSHLSSNAPFMLEGGPTSSFPSHDGPLDFEQEPYRARSGPAMYHGHIRIKPGAGGNGSVWKICAEGPIMPPQPEETPPTETTPPPGLPENPPFVPYPDDPFIPINPFPPKPGLRPVDRHPGRQRGQGLRGGSPPRRTPVREPTSPISDGGSGEIKLNPLPPNAPVSNYPGLPNPPIFDPGDIAGGAVPPELRAPGGSDRNGGNTAPARSPHETSFPSVEGHTTGGSEDNTERDPTIEYGGDLVEPGDPGDPINSYSISATEHKTRNLWKKVYGLDLPTRKKYPKYLRQSKVSKRNKYGTPRKLKKRKKEVTNVWSMLSYLMPNSDNQYNTEKLAKWANNFPKSGEDTGVFFTPGDCTKGNPQGYSDYVVSLMLNHLRSKLSFGEPGSSQVDINWENGKLLIQGSPLKITAADYLDVPGDPGDVYIDPADNTLKVSP